MHQDSTILLFLIKYNLDAVGCGEKQKDLAGQLTKSNFHTILEGCAEMSCTLNTNPTDGENSCRGQNAKWPASETNLYHTDNLNMVVGEEAQSAVVAMLFCNMGYYNQT